MKFKGYGKTRLSPSSFWTPYPLAFPPPVNPSCLQLPPARGFNVRFTDNFLLREPGLQTICFTEQPNILSQSNDRAPNNLDEIKPNR